MSMNDAKENMRRKEEEKEEEEKGRRREREREREDLQSVWSPVLLLLPLDSNPSLSTDPPPTKKAQPPAPMRPPPPPPLPGDDTGCPAPFRSENG